MQNGPTIAVCGENFSKKNSQLIDFQRVGYFSAFCILHSIHSMNDDDLFKDRTRPVRQVDRINAAGDAARVDAPVEIGAVVFPEFAADDLAVRIGDGDPKIGALGEAGGDVEDLVGRVWVGGEVEFFDFRIVGRRNRERVDTACLSKKRESGERKNWE